ncbi:MAG: MOSC domain-containing protein [Phycisphaerales bacterium]
MSTPIPDRPRRVLSVNICRELVSVEHAGARELTGHFKTPVSALGGEAGGRVRVTRDGLEGDRIADARHHGGPDMAIYGISYETHWRWAAELGRSDIGPGAFGENLTLDGMPDDQVCIGDLYRVRPAPSHVRTHAQSSGGAGAPDVPHEGGGAPDASGEPLGPLLQVTIPRGPCWKLGVAMRDPAFPKRFLATCRVGFYLRVVELGDEPTIGPGDTLELVGHAPFVPTPRAGVEGRAGDGSAGEATSSERLTVEAATRGKYFKGA